MKPDLSEQLRESLNHRASTTPAPSFDVDRLIGHGRRVRRIRRASALTAATLAVVVLIGGAFFAAHLLGDRTALQPVRPAPVQTKLRLPNIGACAAGEWIFEGSLSVKGDQRLTLAPPQTTDPNAPGEPVDPSHDFNGDGKTETLQVVTCRIGGSEVDAALALTTTGPNTAVTMDNKPIIICRPAASGGQHLTAVWISQGSIGGAPYQYLANIQGPGGGQLSYDPKTKSWSMWGG